MATVFFNNPKYKKLDYVAAWYKKAADFIGQFPIRSAFVSTNSIVQGEMVDILWKQLFEKYRVSFDFAHTTFRWDSEAKIKAAVHCVIIGFSLGSSRTKAKVLFNPSPKIVDNINAYLMDAPSVFIAKSQKSLSGLPEMTKGCQLIDDGNYVFESESEYLDFIELEPSADKFIKRYYNARGFLNQDKKMFCLCLEGCSPHELKQMPKVFDRVNKVKIYRENSSAESVRAIKDSPSNYFITNIPKEKCIVVPVVTSQNRKYVPIDICDGEAIYTNAVNFIDNATIYLFGLLCSNVHNSWMRAFAGRMKSDYRYSKDLIYNTLPTPTLSISQKAKIEQTAQGILDARALYPDCSLADLYDEVTMPPELRKAHQANDRAVMEAYGFDRKTTTEESCVAELMKLYQKLTQG